MSRRHPSAGLVLAIGACCALVVAARAQAQPAQAVLFAEARVPTLDPRGVVPMRPDLPVVRVPVGDARVLWVAGRVGLQTQLVVLGSTRTDATGTFGWAPPAPDAYALVLAAGGAHGPVQVDDCPGRCDTAAVYAWEVTGPGTHLVPVTSDVAGAFAILDAVVFAQRVVRLTGIAPLAPLRVRWRQDADTRCRTSCYDAPPSPVAPHEIRILGLPDDNDPFDRAIVLHEFAHYLAEAAGQGSGPGGYHDGAPVHARLAFSEGAATGFAAALQRTPIYIDTDAAGGAWVDLSQPAILAAGAGGQQQPLSEDAVAQLVWHAGQQHGLRALADSLTWALRPWLAQPDAQVVVHDWLVAWRCAGLPGAAQLVEHARTAHGLAAPPSTGCRPVAQPTPPATTGLPAPMRDAIDGPSSPAHSPISPWRIVVTGPTGGDHDVMVRLTARTALHDAHVRVLVDDVEVFATHPPTIAGGSAVDVLVSLTPPQRAALRAGTAVVTAHAQARIAGAPVYHRAASWRVGLQIPPDPLPSTSRVVTAGGQALRVGRP